MEYSYLTVFKGTYRHRIDAKGRLPVPAAFRRALAASDHPHLVVTVLDHCLAAYPPSEWQRLEEQLRALPAFSMPVKSLTRLVTSRAADCDLDVQGRILLPAPLRQAVGLSGREAIVVGVLNRFEVWVPETWESFVRESERMLDDVTLDIQWPPPAAPASPRSPGAPPGVRRPQEKPKR